MRKKLSLLLAASMAIASGTVPVQAYDVPQPSVSIEYTDMQNEENVSGDQQQIGQETPEEDAQPADSEEQTAALVLPGNTEEPKTDLPEQDAEEMPGEADDSQIFGEEDDSGDSAAAADEQTDSVEGAETETQPVTEQAGDASAVQEAALTQEIIDGKKYLVYPDGTHFTGWYAMTENWMLYFDPAADGAAATGLTWIEDKMYLFDENGILHRGPGTPVIDGSKYYINNDGTLRTGWVRLGSWTMYFDEATGAAHTGLTEIEGELYLFSASGILHEEGGTPVIDGKKYWINADGSLGVGWKRLGSWTMYFDRSTGAAHTGISEADGSYYLFNGSGILQEGSGIPVIDGNKYWMNSDSSLNSGWLDMGAIKMYFDPATFRAAKGVTVVDGKKYAFDANGCLLTGSGTPVINGKKYCFNPDGTVNTGWYTLGNWTFYFDPQTGAAAVGVVTIDGEQYFFNASGVKQEWMATKAEQYAYKTLNEIGWDLRAAYNWAAAMPYYRMSPDVVPAGVDPTQWYAEFGFENHTGNCYVMASTFYYMARLLGYDVHRVNGYVPISATEYNPHGWCEIDMNGTTYVFDPNFTNEMHMNGYQITYGTSGTWRYSFYSRIN